MYEENGQFGTVTLVLQNENAPLGHHIFQFSIAGRHKCNDLYHVVRDQQSGTCEANYLILSTVAGKGILKMDGKEYALTRDTVALIDCSQDSEYYSASGMEWEFYFIHFTNNNMPAFYTYLYKRKKLVCTFPNAYRISHGIETVIELKNSYQNGVGFKVSRLLSDMVHELLDESQDLHQPDPLLSNIIRYMQDNYAKKVTLQELSGHFYVSKNYLCSLFKRHFNRSPYAYLIQIRIQESKKLLISTNYSLDQIAKRCGFSTPNNYITTYKRLEGMTPHKFRKRECI